MALAVGTSRIPVREALIILEREGLIEWSAFRGTFVANLTENDLRDHFSLLGSAAALISRQLLERGDHSQRNAAAQGVKRLFASNEHETTQRLAELRDALVAAGISYRLAHEFELLTSALPYWRFSSGARPGTGRLFGTDEAEARARHYYEALGEQVIRRLRKDGFWHGPSRGRKMTAS